MYKCAVAEAVSERRLSHARTLLSLSDLPVSSIGYRCGYQSNASFTRAFARRFGMTPTDMRRRDKAPAGSAAAEFSSYKGVIYSRRCEAESSLTSPKEMVDALGLEPRTR